MTKIFAMAAAAFLALTLPALAHNHQVVAQAPHHHSPAHVADASSSTTAFRRANDKMHRDMAIRFSGNADADFLRSMIPHHQGAIDMAKIVLARGKDPQVKKLAQEIITTQESEIAWMKEWLKKHGH